MLFQIGEALEQMLSNLSIEGVPVEKTILGKYVHKDPRAIHSAMIINSRILRHRTRWERMEPQYSMDQR